MIIDFLWYSCIGIFSIASILQISYWALVAHTLLFHKEDKRTECPLYGVSIVIAAHQEYNNLTKLIPLLLQQQYFQYEIIVANDRSTDETEIYLSSIKNPKLRPLHITSPPPDIHPKKWALWQAIKMAKYEIVLLTDADCIPESKQWIAEMQAQFQPQTMIVLGVSPYFTAKTWLNLFIRYETAHTAAQYLTAAACGYATMGVGRNVAYRKKFYLENLNKVQHLQHLVGGDDDLFINHTATKDNIAIAYQAKTLVHSFPKTTFRDWFRQKKRHLAVGKYYPSKAKIILGLLQITNLCTEIFWIIIGISYQTKMNWAFIFIIHLIYFVKMCIFVLVFHKIAHITKQPIQRRLLPILNWIYIIYWIIVGTLSFKNKTKQWR
ncbi:MAG: glycosyltransferase [Cytophagales bacterium]|nr:MAG: glycosyltransferase [Cytophagales bacterium]